MIQQEDIGDSFSIFRLGTVHQPIYIELEILDRGALLSQYQPHTPSLSHTDSSNTSSPPTMNNNANLRPQCPGANFGTFTPPGFGEGQYPGGLPGAHPGAPWGFSQPGAIGYGAGFPGGGNPGPFPPGQVFEPGWLAASGPGNQFGGRR